MVSIVLLTTEEALQKNGFWYCLDTVWVTEELEPFEEVKPEHKYTKPLSRDFYYTKFPEIPRSESEDENSLSLSGFRSKHHEWQAKICIKRFDAQRRNSTKSNLSLSSVRLTRSTVSMNDDTRRVTSLVENSTKLNRSESKLYTLGNDDRVKDFIDRLLKSVPPPPIEDLQDCAVGTNTYSILVPQIKVNNLSDVELPDYDDFEKNKLIQSNNEQSLAPATSTLKRCRRKVSFNLDKPDTENEDSWYESIYGASGLMEQTEEQNYSSYVKIENQQMNSLSSTDYLPSWSDIINECGVNSSIVRSKESLYSFEDVVTRSHCERNILDPLQLDDTDEIGYARFAIYKIHQTLKIEAGMKDSSSMKDLNSEFNEENTENKFIEPNASFIGSVYRLVSIDENERVNKADKDH